MFPPNPRRMHESYADNWQQQNSSNALIFGTQVINPRRETARDLHFPSNNNESNPPTSTTCDDEIMVSFYKMTWEPMALYCGCR